MWPISYQNHDEQGSTGSPFFRYRDDPTSQVYACTEVSPSDEEELAAINNR
jgi:hypothetical protein